MADQMERLIAAVEKVSAYLTRLSTYEYLVSLGKASAAVSVAVSATLGMLLNAINFVGTTIFVSSLSGSMTVTPGGVMEGNAASLSSISGVVSVATELAGSIATSSTLGINILNSTQFAGSIVAISSGSAHVLNAVKMAGVSVTETITARAHLDIN